jgi:hypothetical protein
LTPQNLEPKSENYSQAKNEIPEKRSRSDLLDLSTT